MDTPLTVDVLSFVIRYAPSDNDIKYVSNGPTFFLEGYFMYFRTVHPRSNSQCRMRFAVESGVLYVDFSVCVCPEPGSGSDQLK